MENKKKPAIRFKGFCDDWEQRKLGDMCQITMGQSPDGSTYSEEPSDYILVQGNADLKDGWVNPRIWTTQKTKTAQAGDLIMSVRAPAGAMGKTAYDVILGRGVAGIKGNEFLYQSLVKMDSNGYWKKMAAGSTFESVNSDVVKNADMVVPQDMEEQEKIGFYFQNLDRLITLHQRKCNKLQLIKKSMLEKMFPQNSQNIPEVRFKGFTDAWEQRKVAEIGNIITGSTPKTSISDNYGGEFLFVSPADIQGNRYVDETITTLTKKGFDQGRKIRERASLFVSIGSTIGKVAQTSQESTTNQQINAVEPYDNFDDDFIFTSLENISGSIKAIATNQAVPIVNKTTFGETEIQVPSELAEQQRIGAYFRNIDHLITLHQRELEKLQIIKKSMLEKMFV